MHEAMHGYSKIYTIRRAVMIQKPLWPKPTNGYLLVEPVEERITSLIVPEGAERNISSLFRVLDVGPGFVRDDGGFTPVGAVGVAKNDVVYCPHRQLFQRVKSGGREWAFYPSDAAVAKFPHLMDAEHNDVLPGRCSSKAPVPMVAKHDDD